MIIYVPALLSGMENQIKRDKLWKGFDASWFTEKGMYFHPHILTSYYYAKTIADYRGALNIRRDAVLWVDSGGYTVATKGAELDALEVLRWQEANADISYTLDYPPIQIYGGSQTSMGGFRDIGVDELRNKAIKTAKNNEIFCRERSNKDLRIYNVIHGVTLSYLNIWWRHNGGFPFEGYALGTKPAFDALHQASKLAFLHSKGVRENVHMLGLSGIRVLPVLAYISKYVDKISFDSTSYGRGALNRTYFLPHKLNSHVSFGEDYERGSFQIVCSCPVCTKLGSADELADAHTWPGMLIALHNLYLIKEQITRLNNCLDDFDKFKEETESMTGEKYEHSMAAEAINFFDHYLKYGLEEAYSLWFPDRCEDKKPQRKLF